MRPFPFVLFLFSLFVFSLLLLPLDARYGNAVRCELWTIERDGSISRPHELSFCMEGCAFGFRRVTLDGAGAVEQLERVKGIASCCENFAASNETKRLEMILVPGDYCLEKDRPEWRPLKENEYCCCTGDYCTGQTIEMPKLRMHQCEGECFDVNAKRA